MKETLNKEQRSPSLVTTDYDNFKTLRFFINQQRKAEQMLKDIESFRRSFIDSKLVSFYDYVKEHPVEAIEQFKQMNAKRGLYEQDVDDMTVFCRRLSDSFDYCHHYEDSKQKSYVVYHDKLHYVSKFTGDYEINISKDENTIDFTFTDYDFFAGVNRTRWCTLTYKTDNNELINIKAEVWKDRKRF